MGWAQCHGLGSTRILLQIGFREGGCGRGHESLSYEELVALSCCGNEVMLLGKFGNPTRERGFSLVILAHASGFQTRSIASRGTSSLVHHGMIGLTWSTAIAFSYLQRFAVLFAPEGFAGCRKTSSPARSAVFRYGGTSQVSILYQESPRQRMAKKGKLQSLFCCGERGQYEIEL